MDRRSLLTGGAALAAMAALPRGPMAAVVNPPGLTSAQALRLAPRRTRLTKTLRSGLSGVSTISGISSGGVPLTFLAAIPIEAPCYAVRLGFANCYNVDMTISKASVVPSDSYGLCPTMLTAQAASNTLVVPTGGATLCPIYFDNSGADVPTVNTSGTTRSLTLSADATNAANAAKAYTIKWSDFVPCTSIPRADGGTQHLLFVYVTISTIQMAVGGNSSRSADPGYYAFDNDAVAPRGRTVYTGCAWSGGTDWADNPTGVGWKTVSVFPLHAVQYLTANPGIQVVLNGDSLTAAPPEDQYSTSLHRAAWDISTPSLPIEVASMAWGGTASSVYEVTLRNNAAALHPSVVAYQPLSRNDTFTTAGLQVLLAKALANADTFRTSYGSQIIWNNAGCEPSADGNSTQTAAFVDMRARLQAVAQATGIPLIDAPAVIGQAAKPWLYITDPVVSSDGTHPNSTGAELVVPQAKAALTRLLGR